jgi:virginiamycin B lyase
MRGPCLPGRRLVVIVLVALVAGACGGGGEREAPPAPTRPPGPPVAAPGSTAPTAPQRVTVLAVPAGAGPHDVAPAKDGGIWFTAQAGGYLGHVQSGGGAVTRVELGEGSRPHGVITDADGTAWVTDGGLNAILRVDGATREVRRFALPSDRGGANLNTAALDPDGVLWFTGQAGVYGRLDTRTGRIQVYDAPGGPGPYGITTTPGGDVWYASLAGSHIAHIDPSTAQATAVRPPTPGQGARRIWSDSHGRLWVSEWNAGQLARYDPARRQWREWRLPGQRPMPYAIYVDDGDLVWISDFGANRLLRFDPGTERFTAIALPGPAANVRQLLGRPGQVFGAASALDRLVVVRTGS